MAKQQPKGKIVPKSKGTMRKIVNVVDDLSTIARKNATNRTKNRAKNAESKQKKADAYATKVKARSYKPIATQMIASVTAQKESEERTKRERAKLLANNQSKMIDRWNGVINMNSEAAEGTGDSIGGISGLIPIGDE